ncbi:MAG: nitroreductase [Clostridium baratii]|uniref:ArpU family phage packaging/lysis transcriptional regulator n=1 Tax=Clostridium baratii TaxID=1561 RepID=UPI00242AB727|nr:ArpU family phage packaging/lysis transcriptional regulator [Clostridium baratii]MBS6041978.1 nitroreductase [Clostridium baratii]
MSKTWKLVKKSVESDLFNFPLWLINAELSGLGSATDWTKVYNKVHHPSSPTEKIVIENEEYKGKVEKILNVLVILSGLQKSIIEEWYFRDMKCREQILEELKISESVFYRERNKALEKFAVALGYK